MVEQSSIFTILLALYGLDSHIRKYTSYNQKRLYTYIFRFYFYLPIQLVQLKACRQFSLVCFRRLFRLSKKWAHLSLKQTGQDYQEIQKKAYIIQRLYSYMFQFYFYLPIWLVQVCRQFKLVKKCADLICYRTQSKLLKKCSHIICYRRLFRFSKKWADLLCFCVDSPRLSRNLEGSIHPAIKRDHSHMYSSFTFTYLFSKCQHVDSSAL